MGSDRVAEDKGERGDLLWCSGFTVHLVEMMGFRKGSKSREAFKGGGT